MENDFKLSVHLPWGSQHPCEKFGYTKSFWLHQEFGCAAEEARWKAVCRKHEGEGNHLAIPQPRQQTQLRHHLGAKEALEDPSLMAM